MSIDSTSLSTTQALLPPTTEPKRALRAGSAVLALLVACLLGFAGAAPAQAHDQLIESAPAPGAALDAAPADVTLRYSADIMDIGPMIVLEDAAGTAWATGEPVIDGSEVTSTIDDALPDGTYTINWRVVSSDGHPITGTVPFTVGDASAADALAAEAATPAPSEAAVPDADSAPASGSDSGATTEPTAEVTSRSAFDVPRLLLIGGLGAVVALGVAWVIVRSRKGAQQDGDADAR